MSTTAQRAMERLARAINQAFSGATVFVRDADFAQYGGGTNEPVSVKAEALGVKSCGVAGTGIRLTIGRVTATFDENGQLVGVEEPKAAKPEFVNPPPPAQTRPGDFSRVDLSGCQPSPPKPRDAGDFSGVDWKCSE